MCILTLFFFFPLTVVDDFLCLDDLVVKEPDFDLVLSLETLEVSVFACEMRWDFVQNVCTKVL